ncbi:helix-turn-helix domain-containing protein [Fluviicola chungangensis]|uniref:Helix-turn-helix transcriptional regulator n=1 Tax=Fluviicola chungangensis TaxID=2597671 RepID=A0A556MQ23_9FLAO|nr:AraC family transcriptional regulator [Fluviicola chungangensis]TSJ42044.1 helix-turn-helix transcriptional regulator [Fluviicola chungangensis]
MKIYIKYMVSLRCKKMVGAELKKLGVIMPKINQGMVEFQEELSAEQKIQFQERILSLGFEVLDSANSKLLDRISATIIDLIYKHPEMSRQEYPDYLVKNLAFDYSEIKYLFSEVHGINLPQFILIQQVERMKEMLLYEDLKVKEIAQKMHYRNGAQLTRVFKKVTDLTPFYFKKMKEKRIEVQQESNSK